MQNVCACNNQTRKQSRTRNVSEGVLFVSLLQLVSGWRTRKDPNFWMLFQANPDLYLEGYSRPLQLRELPEDWWALILAIRCVIIYAFHPYSIEYFQAVNLLRNEGASLAHFQP